MTDHIPKGSLWLHDAIQIAGKSRAVGWTGSELSTIERRPWGPLPIDRDPDRWMTEMGDRLYLNMPPEAVSRLKLVVDWIEQQAFEERLGLWFVSENTLRRRTLPTTDLLGPEGRAVLATGHFYQAPIFVSENELIALLAATAKCSDEVAPQASTKLPRPKEARRPDQRNATADVIRELWKLGVPKHLRALERNKVICDECRKRGMTPPSPRTISRALQELARAN